MDISNRGKGVGVKGSEPFIAPFDHLTYAGRVRSTLETTSRRFPAALGSNAFSS